MLSHNGAVNLASKLFAQAQAAWPDVILNEGESAFHQHLQRHAGTASEPASLLVEDLFLALGCSQGNAAALRAFDRKYLSQIDRFLQASDRQPAFVDELRQLLRDKLLVGKDGAPPKIADYSGRGSLQSWVRTAVVHTARNMHRHRKTDALRESSDAVMGALTAEGNPEVQYLKARYREEFREAFYASIQTLPSEQIEVIRLHYVDGLNIDRIGQRLGVNRATVARWRTAAQQTLFELTRKQLRQHLKISDTEFVSIVQLLRSQLDVGLARFLRGDGGK
jgi:RNA polymerase sigma-70 factor (ECF subfamily)